MLFIRNISKNKTKWAIFSLFFCFLIIFVFSTKNFAWAEIIVPSAQPPDKNTAGYLQISDIDQGKQGPLRLGSSDVASPFNYQLEVLGEGADLSNATIKNNLQVSDTLNDTNKTLIVDSENNKVCIGECLGVENSKLEVSGTGVIVNNSENNGNTISVYNNNQEAIYGTGDTGIYSIAYGDNIAVQGLSTSGTALEGNNIQNIYSSVAGISNNGQAIYGINTSPLGMWSAYFNGRLESNTDISAAKIITKNYFNSLVGFTYGQIVDSFDFGNSKIMYNDGTYLWLAQDENIIKIRASDGFQIFSTTIGNVGESVNALIFDDYYYWAVYDSGVSKINSVDGTISCSINLSDPRGIVFDGQNYWVTVNGTGELVNINENCGLISTKELVDENDYTLGKIIYDGSFLSLITTNKITQNGSIINVNPSTSDGVRWDGLVGQNPVDIYFDNEYYWVLGASYGKITRFYMQNNKVCTELALDGSPKSCQNDSDCSGTCTFFIPQPYGSYYISYDYTRAGNTPTNFIFTDKDIWINNNWLDSGNLTHSELVKMSLYDPNETESIALAGTTNGLVFDQTYLWISSSDSDLVKIFSGIGYGHTDLTDTVALQNNNPLISQWGSYSISGDSRFGANLISEGNLNSSGNIWGDTSTELNGGVGVLLSPGAHNCPNGQFINNITLNGSKQVTGIECRSL